jgi:hypothetical protein
VTPLVRPPFEKNVVFWGNVATCRQSRPSVDRSSRNPVSLFALSVHCRTMRPIVDGVAVRFVGALGGGSVVADDVFE